VLAGIGMADNPEPVPTSSNHKFSRQNFRVCSLQIRYNSSVIPKHGAGGQSLGSEERRQALSIC